MPAAKDGDSEITPAPRTEIQVVPPWADTLTRWLDELITVPGTRIGIGLDAIIGLLLPGLGDLLSGTGSLALLVLAVRSGVPRVVLLRMVVNLAIDAVVGSVPVLGDVFDVAWKANRKNLDLLRRHGVGSGSPTASRRATAGDYAVVALAAVVVACAVILPIVLLVLLVRWLAE
jgi:hypothetical protein